ncbi:MAG: class IV adenylate cyclase [Calditrichaeota bacterium]|nr:class IV adenylate cyclase [Calditrichota bacterium]
MKNIEIKYFLSSPRSIKLKLKEHPEISFQHQAYQKDVYFRIPDYRLKIRIEENQQPHIIKYLRPDKDEPRISDYQIVKIDNLSKTLREFQQKFGILGQVEKWRELYIFRNVRIHLDNVTQLGWFLEFESVIIGQYDETAAQKNLQMMIDYFAPFVNGTCAKSYIDLILESNKY